MPIVVQKDGAAASGRASLCDLKAEMFSNEHLFTIHYSFVISNNILARGLEFRSIFRLMYQPASPSLCHAFPLVGEANLAVFLKEDEIRFFSEFEEKKGTMKLPVVGLSPSGSYFKSFALKPLLWMSF